jgi:hypothetical protein
MTILIETSFEHWRDDPDELNDFLDEGCARAGQLLTRRAVAAGIAACQP